MDDETKIEEKMVYGVAFDVKEDLLSNMKFIKDIVMKATEKGNMHLVEMISKKFKLGGGVSVVAIVEESHIAIHTWPEHKYAVVDVVTCGDQSDPIAAYDYIIEKLNPAKYTKHIALGAKEKYICDNDILNPESLVE